MLTQADIQAAADRIAAALKPKKIILFGSYARGDANEHSDLDLMVIEPKTPSKRLAAMAVGMRVLADLPVGADVLVYSETEYDKRSGWCSEPAYWALREGKLLYDA
jgi:predicted nucleotidyltransferase